MKAIAIVALTAMISIPSSSFAWGPARGGVVVARPFFPRAVIGRPFFPHVIVGRPFARVPFRFFPNRVAIQSPFFFGPSWYGSYYAPSFYPYMAPYPYYTYPPYDYAPVPPPPAPDTTYDRGYSEGYTRGYEEAQKEINRLLDLEKTPSDEHEKSGAEGNL
jgi:hypothetical protein